MIGYFPLLKVTVPVRQSFSQPSLNLLLSRSCSHSWNYFFSIYLDTRLSFVISFLPTLFYTFLYTLDSHKQKFHKTNYPYSICIIYSVIFNSIVFVQKYCDPDLPINHHLQFEKCLTWLFSKCPWLIRLDQDSSV